MAQTLDHLFLKRWPFRNVPDDESRKLWADRAVLREQIDRLLWRWHRSEQSTIHLMWADLGAGKSHTLRHIESRLMGNPSSSMYPVYCVMPRELRTFLDVYQAIVSGLDVARLGRMAITMLRQVGSKEGLVRSAFPALPEAVWALTALQSPHDHERKTAAQWIGGTRGLTKRELSAIGVSRSIKTTDEAVAALSGFLYISRSVEKASRFVVMFDEAQRLSQASNKVRQDVNVGLQTWYDASPHNLTLVLSFGSGDEAYVRHMVSPELQRREDHERLRLDLLNQNDIVEFVGDILDQSRTQGAPDRWFPLTEALVHNLAARLGNGDGATAGAVMKAFNAVLTEMDYMIGIGKQQDIDCDALLTKGLDTVDAT